MNMIETTGDRWITSSLDGTIKIWDLDWQLIDTMVSHQHEVIAICSMTVESGTELILSQRLLMLLKERSDTKSAKRSEKKKMFFLPTHKI